MNVPGVLADLTLLMGVPLLTLAAYLLWRQVRKFHRGVTRAQAIGVTAVLVHTLVFGVIFKNNDWPEPRPVSTDATKIITRGIEYGTALVVSLAVLGLYLRRPKDDR